MPRVAKEVKVERRLDARPPKSGPRAEMVKGLVTFALWIGLIFVMQTKDQLAQEIAQWEQGECRFSGFSGPCEECKMTLSVIDQRLALPSIYTWDVGEEFQYSYFDDKQVLEGDMFACCDTSRLSCCDFELEAGSGTFCDECKCGEQPCEPAPWKCRFLTDEFYIPTKVIPGYDTRDQIFGQLQIVLSVIASLATLCHPFSRRLFGHAMDDVIQALIKILRGALGKDVVEEVKDSESAESVDRGPIYDDDPDDNPFDHPLPPGSAARRFRVDDAYGNTAHALVELSPAHGGGYGAYVPGLLQPLEWSPLDTTRELAELARLSRQVDPQRQQKAGNVRDRGFRDVQQMSRSLEAVDWKQLRKDQYKGEDMAQTWSSFGTPKRTPVPVRTDMSMTSCLSVRGSGGRRSQSVDSPDRSRQAWRTPDSRRKKEDAAMKAKMSPGLTDQMRLNRIPSEQRDRTPSGPGHMPRSKQPHKLFADMDGFALFVKPEQKRAAGKQQKGPGGVDALAAWMTSRPSPSNPSPAPPKALPP